MLPPIKKAIRDRFEEALGCGQVFDFYGLERGGHNAIVEWILRLGGKPHMLIRGAQNDLPGCSLYHPSCWFSMEKPPVITGIIYGPDMDIKYVPSRIEHKAVVVAIRDLRNLIASRIKWHEKMKRVIFRLDDTMLLLWKKYAQQTLGEEDFFDNRCVPIVFDRWFSDIDYRKNTQESMNKTFNWNLTEDSNIGIEKVAIPGGGSSFDNVDYADRAQKMKVTERWKKYKNHPIMKRLVTPELLELNSRLIGES